MDKNQVIKRLKAAKNQVDWDTICNEVSMNGYPDWWHREVVSSGLAKRKQEGWMCGYDEFDAKPGATFIPAGKTNAQFDMLAETLTYESMGMTLYDLDPNATSPSGWI